MDVKKILESKGYTLVIETDDEICVEFTGTAC